MTVAPSGTGDVAPDRGDRPPRITTVPRSIACPAAVRIRALVIATIGPETGA